MSHVWYDKSRLLDLSSIIPKAFTLTEQTAEKSEISAAFCELDQVYGRVRLLWIETLSRTRQKTRASRGIFYSLQKERRIRLNSSSLERIYEVRVHGTVQNFHTVYMNMYVMCNVHVHETLCWIKENRLTYMYMYMYTTVLKELTCTRTCTTYTCMYTHVESV